MSTIIDLISGYAGWSQHARLLTLTTPLGANALLAEAAEIEENLGPDTAHAGFRIRLSVLATDAHLALTSLLGQAARLELQTAASRTTLRPFHGHISQITRRGANGGFARYELIIEPWLAFLGQRQDSYLFQDKSVIEIVDELFGDWSSQGKLVPAWRWELADRSAYPKRGMTVQYQETDLVFLKRLLAEEGLFCWFEHKTDDGDTLGSHTLVIADHNAAFQPNPQARIRYTQAGATLAEDSLDRWTAQRQIDSTDSNAQSWDYRSRSGRPQNQATAIDNGKTPRLIADDDPGQYAWSSSAHGERLLRSQREALDARLKQFHGQGTVRSAAPGTTFTLAEHPEHDRDSAEQQRFLITRVTHQVRNNLAEIIPDAIAALGPEQDSAKPVDLYRNQLDAIRVSIPWRPLLADSHGRWIHPRPTAHGLLTAIVVGDGQPTHTDRDLRIRVQFPWQRGSNAANRLAHPSGAENAPANHSLGVWLRAITPVAGANWGGHLTPRPGQEVLVAFQNGNIDRPVIIGATFNGQGNADASGNQQGNTTSQASANAPAFFAGQEAKPHTHGASLSGLKSQQHSNSQDGQGGHNQLIFDDTPGQARIHLGTTQAQSQLQLGHLKHHADNARQQDRGHGAELTTQGAIALRAGSGLLISADARPGASSQQLDSREAIAQLETAQSLLTSLADVGKKQNAGLKNEPEAAKLSALEGLQQAQEDLKSNQSQGAQEAGDSAIKTTQGGTGSITAWASPRLHYAAPGGIAQLTPGNAVLVAGKTLSLAAGQDIQLIAQGNHSLAIKNGLSLFTVGKANNKSKPNSETGIALHAGTGKVSLQSQSGKTNLAADKKVTIASTTANLTASGKTHLLVTAQGAYLKIEGGNIQLHAPGKVELKSSQKGLTVPAIAPAIPVSMPSPSPMNSLAPNSKVTEVTKLTCETALDDGSANDGSRTATQKGMVFGKSYTFAVAAYTDGAPSEKTTIKWLLKFQRHGQKNAPVQEKALELTGDKVEIKIDDKEYCDCDLTVCAYIHQAKKGGTLKQYVHNRFRWFDAMVVERQLKARLESPWKIQQGGSSLCGMAALYYVMAKKAPQAYEKLAKDLLRTGEHVVGNYTVKPANSVAEKMYATNPASSEYEAMQMFEADWIVLATSRSGESDLGYDGIGDTTLDRLQSVNWPDILTKMLQSVVQSTQVDSTGVSSAEVLAKKSVFGMLHDVFSDSDLDELLEIEKKYQAGKHILLMVDSNVVGGEASYNTTRVLSNMHWVVYEGGLRFKDAADSEVADYKLANKVYFKVYTWGSDPKTARYMQYSTEEPIKPVSDKFPQLRHLKYGISLESWRSNYYGYIEAN